jgi:DNA-binding MarR family transcriptional regulator
METSLIREFRQRMRSYRRMITAALEQDCASLPVSVPQVDALLEIERLDETTIAHLSRVIRLDKSTLSRTVDSLVDLGFLTRTPDSSDRRYNVLSLTSEGKAVCDEVNRCSDEGLETVFQGIPEEERETALRGFIRVVDALDAFECSACAEETGGAQPCGDSSEGQES